MQKMQKSLFIWQLIGFIFTVAAGTLLHFAYDWSNQNIIFAAFSAINESIWEHMKLLFFPMFIFSLLESRFLSNQYQNFWCSKLLGILLGLILIPVLYYTYTGIFGISLDWINIGIFFLAAAAAYLLELLLLKQDDAYCTFSKFPFILIILLALAFVVLTFVKPNIPIFQAPIARLFSLCK